MGLGPQEIRALPPRAASRELESHDPIPKQLARAIARLAARLQGQDPATLRPGICPLPLV